MSDTTRICENHFPTLAQYLNEQAKNGEEIPTLSLRIKRGGSAIACTSEWWSYREDGSWKSEQAEFHTPLTKRTIANLFGVPLTRLLQILIRSVRR